MPNDVCPKCGSSETIPNVHVTDQGHYNVAHDLCATVYARPDAAIFKQPVNIPLRARVCANCGFTELYVSEPQKLLSAANRAEKEVRRKKASK